MVIMKVKINRSLDGLVTFFLFGFFVWKHAANDVLKIQMLFFTKSEEEQLPRNITKDNSVICHLCFYVSVRLYQIEAPKVLIPKVNWSIRNLMN